MSHLQPAVSCARWLAPEQITSASIAGPTEKTDIWSFGLLCFEVFTGIYHGHPDFRVLVLLRQGTHPEHPGSTAVGLSPKMWDIMQSCWQMNPARRPSISEIQSMIRDTLPHRDGEPFLSLRRIYTGLPLSRHVDRQPPPRNIDIHVPTLFTPATDTSPPNKAMRSTVEMSSPLPPLGLTGIPSVTHGLGKVASTGFLGVVDQQIDAQTGGIRATLLHLDRVPSPLSWRTLPTQIYRLYSNPLDRSIDDPRGA
jgi:serine/threonine protein kinase